MKQKTYKFSTDQDNITKFLSKYNDKIKTRLAKEMMELQFFPLKGDIKKLKNKYFAGMPLYRKRVNDFRIFFVMDHDEEYVHIPYIKHRKDAY